MRKVSCDLADGGKYAGSFGLFTLTGAIYRNFLSNKIVSRATRSRSGELERTPKSLSPLVFKRMSALECSTSNGRAVSADKVKCRSTFRAQLRVQARARLLRITQVNP